MRDTFPLKKNVCDSSTSTDFATEVADILISAMGPCSKRQGWCQILTSMLCTCAVYWQVMW